MAILTVEISDSLKERLDREVASGRFKDRDALVQSLLEAGIRSQWRAEVDKKIDEALDDVERGDVVAWQQGDCAKLGREYLKEKHAREAKS
jgi:Arc/MetJ-type ribon-helix-helix transcriptional regulator